MLNNKTALFGLILALLALITVSCSPGKGKQKESLYGELKASEGQAYEAHVLSYVGTGPLYYGCKSFMKNTGSDFNSSCVTNCPEERDVYFYSGFILAEDGPGLISVPVTITSYEILQQATGIMDTIQGQPYQRVVVEATLYSSTVRSYRGTGDYCFIVLPPTVQSEFIETNAEIRAAGRNPEGVLKAGYEGNRP